MMNIFASLKKYSTPWTVKSVRDFYEEEIEEVVNAKVVESQYGLSVQFNMKSGGMTFIPLDNSSRYGIGAPVDLRKAKLTTLQKHGEDDIFRVTI